MKYANRGEWSELEIVRRYFSKEKGKCVPDLDKLIVDLDDGRKSFFVPFEVPSKKNDYVVKYKWHFLNGQRKIKMAWNKRIKQNIPFRPIVGKGKKTLAYEKNSYGYYLCQAKSFNKRIREISNEDNRYPVSPEIVFVRKTKRAFDYNNVGQIVQDQMVKHNWIPDDNYKYFKPVYGDVEINSLIQGVKIIL